jgi:hypothetical protein
LTVRDQLPKERRQGVIVSLDSSELEASVRLGQPASVRAAWLEALFALHLGARTREFACGLGMRAVATVDEGASGYLDLSVLRLADGSGPVQWLGAEALQTLERGDLACLVEVDLGIVRESIEKEISRRQLVVTGSGRLCLQLRGGMFSLYIDSESLLSTAVGRGLLLQLELEHELERVQQRLAALDNGGQDLIGRLQPQSVRLQPESTNMLLRMPGGEIKVDVGDYVDASVGARESMFAQWVEFS